MSVWIVVGGQYGSEGKGKVAACIALRESIDICIRCGGPNSGHSFQNENGEMVLLRQIPTGFVRDKARLLIPAGALIDPPLLEAEIQHLKLDPFRVGVDRNAMIISTSDKNQERQLRMYERLSSTLCGVGAAVARRALRCSDVVLAADAARNHHWLRPLITDVAAEANSAIDQGKNVLVEGTQGTGLSLYHSEHYPKTTSRDTTASGFISEVGLSPRVVDEIVLVLRTFPIRVAGSQAGPIHDETSWEQVQHDSGSPVPLHEYTTVTGRLRRVGRFEWEHCAISGRLNRPTRLAINFLDYIDYHNRTATSFAELTEGTRDFVQRVQDCVGVPACYLGVGPKLNETLDATKHGSVNLREHLPEASYNSYAD